MAWTAERCPECHGLSVGVLKWWAKRTWLLVCRECLTTWLWSPKSATSRKD